MIAQTQLTHPELSLREVVSKPVEVKQTPG